MEEGTQYGILSSKRQHVFLRRPTDPTSRHVDFTPVFDCELQTSPSLRVIYLYLLYLAKDAPKLEPTLRPSTAPGQKWVPGKASHKTPDGGADADQHTHDDFDDDGGGYVGSEADSNMNQSAAKAAGPSAHTRSKDASDTRKRPRQSSGSKQQPMQAPIHHHADKLQAHLRQLLARLPTLERSCIACGTAMRFGSDHVVSRFGLRRAWCH